MVGNTGSVGAICGVRIPYAAHIESCASAKAGTPKRSVDWQYPCQSVLPAFGFVVTSSSSIDPTYRALAHPSVLAFFLFINLSTSRLSPVLCRLSALVAAVSYPTAALYLGWKPSLAGEPSLLSPYKAVFDFALEFVIGGFVAEPWSM
jgi:hypothetical protein